MGRSPCCDKDKVKKGPWSAEEDAMLSSHIANFGYGGNWISLPKRAGLNRCGKSCRLRWLNYLRPDIKHGDFTEEEDHTIFSLYNTIGSRWSVIASNLAGRTDNDVKNYWNTKLKKKISSGKLFNNNNNKKKNNNNNVPIIFSETTNYNPGILSSAHMNIYHHITKQNDDDLFINMEEGDVKHAQSYVVSSSSTTTTPDISSYSSGLSSSMDINYQSSSGSTTVSNNNNNVNEDDEFWMDLLSDSFEDVVNGSKLEEKICEIASLLDDSFRVGYMVK